MASHFDCQKEFSELEDDTNRNPEPSSLKPSSFSVIEGEEGTRAWQTTTKDRKKYVRIERRNVQIRCASIATVASSIQREHDGGDKKNYMQTLLLARLR